MCINLVAPDVNACTPDMKISERYRFDWLSHYSWFSSFAAKWVMGVKGELGSSPLLGYGR